MVTVQELLADGVLIDPEILKEGIDDGLLEGIVRQYGDDLMVIDKEVVEKARQERASSASLPKPTVPLSSDGNVRVVWSYEQASVKRSYGDFVTSLQMRFKELERLLKGRQELSTVTSIGRIKAKKEREAVSCIGMILEKAETANGNIMLTLEDFSGQIKALVTEKKRGAFDLAKDLQYDEVIGVSGMAGGDIIFVDTIIYPDIPLTKEFRKAPVEEYATFIGDPHFGSKVFLKEEFERFLIWINGKTGNDEQREIARKTKYIFVTGDLIEGVGVYPGQEHDLAIEDITKQYEEAARYLARLPSHMHIILFTGNHDAGRLAEPQEPMLRRYAQAIYDLPNVTILSNPAMVNIGATSTFPGLDCLLYHGGSFIYYADNIPSIRSAGGQKRVDLIMHYLLQRRHLAPTHNAALTIPTVDRDWLLIDTVPDLFITGHIHRVSVSNYRNVTCINSGCWTETTEDQVKRGLEPQPAKLVVLNLKTRAAKVMNFKKETTAPVVKDSAAARAEEAKAAQGV